MNEYYITRLFTGTRPIDEVIDIDAFIQRLQTWCHSVEARPTTDPLNPYALSWEIESDSKRLEGRLAKTGYMVRFHGDALLVARFAVWYRSLIPEHERISFGRLDDPKARSIDLTLTTSVEEVLAAPLHQPMRRRKSAPPPWRLWPGGQLGQFLPMNPRYPFASIAQIFGAPDGTLWVSDFEEMGIAMYQHGHWTLTSKTATSDFVWYRDQLWVTGRANHLFRYDGGQWYSISVPFTWCRFLEVDTANKLWAAPREGLWYSADGYDWEALSLPWVKPFIRNFCVVTPEEIWMTREGEPAIHHWHSGAIETIPFPRKARSIDEVSVLRTDKTGNLWVGTRQAGLWRWDGQDWEQMPRVHHLEEAGLVGPQALDVCIDDEQRVWVATGKGVSYFQDGTWHVIVIAVAPPSHEQVTPVWPIYSSTSCLHLDTVGRLWIGTHQGEVAWIDTTRSPYDDPDEELFVQVPAENIRFAS